MIAVFQKTAKGHIEIATRQARLAPRLRTALILVDGKRNEAELRALTPAQADDALQALLEGGFIEAVAATVDHVDLPLPAEPLAEDAPPAKPSVAPISVKAAQRAASRWLYDTMGPMADPLNLKIERARDTAELADALRHAYQVVLGQFGPERARQFDEHVAKAARS